MSLLSLYFSRLNMGSHSLRVSLITAYFSFLPIVLAASDLHITNKCMIKLYYTSGNGLDESALTGASSKSIPPGASIYTGTYENTGLFVRINDFEPVDSKPDEPALEITAGKLMSDSHFLTYQFFERNSSPSPLMYSKRTLKPAQAASGDCKMISVEEGHPAPALADDNWRKTCAYKQEMDLEFVVENCIFSV